jgi:hypothetical protein
VFLEKQEAQGPTRQLNISGSSEQRAAINIQRVVERFIAQLFGHGEGRVKLVD